MTWGELKNEVLGLMFSNVNGTQKISVSDASVSEYVLNMPDAAQFAFSDLSDVCPYIEEVSFELPLSDTVIDLKEKFPQFIRFLEREATCEEPRGSYSKFSGYTLFGNNKMRITENTSGTVRLYASCFPIYPTDTLPDDTEIPYPREALTAASYYIAHRLFAEDDISLSVQYLNMYEEMKENLSKKYSRDLYEHDEFSNKAGWL